MDAATFAEIVKTWPVLAIVAAAFYAFMRISDDARKKERESLEAQRAWQDEMSKKRDAEQERRDQAWRDFLGGMQARSDAAAQRTTEVQSKLIERIDTLTAAINQHDVYTRAKMTRYDDLADAILTSQEQETK